MGWKVQIPEFKNQKETLILMILEFFLNTFYGIPVSGGHILTV